MSPVAACTRRSPAEAHPHMTSMRTSGAAPRDLADREPTQGRGREEQSEIGNARLQVLGGPMRFRSALKEGIERGAFRKTGRNRYAATGWIAGDRMSPVSTPTPSKLRLAVALGLQTALAALDAAIAGSTLTITGTVLLVLARHVNMTSARWRSPVRSPSRSRSAAPGGTTNQHRARSPDRLLFAVFAAPRGGGGPGARAGDRASTRLLATEARLDGILGSLGEAVTVHDERGKTVYVNQAAVKLLGSAQRRRRGRPSPARLAKRFHITHEDGSPVAVEDAPGAGSSPARPRRRCSPAASGAPARRPGCSSRRRCTRIRRAPGSRSTSSRTSPRPRPPSLRQRPSPRPPVARLLTRLRADASRHRPRDAAAGGLVRDRPARRAGRGRSRSPTSTRPRSRWRTVFAAVIRPTWTPRPVLPRSSAGAPSLYPEIPDALLVAAARDDEHLRLIRELGMRSAMAVPMRIADVTLGAISLVAAESGRRFDEADLAFAEDLALRAATAIQNARLYAEQERVAHTLQASLLPESLPDLPGWEAQATYHAGERGAEVGGDSLRHPAGRGRPPDRARRRHRQGDRGGGPDFARAPLGADGSVFTISSPRVSCADQPGAARAAAAVAGHRRLRAAGHRRGERAAHRRVRRTSPLPLCRRPGEPPSRSATTASCSGSTAGPTGSRPPSTSRRATRCCSTPTA